MAGGRRQLSQILGLVITLVDSPGSGYHATYEGLPWSIFFTSAVPVSAQQGQRRPSYDENIMSDDDSSKRFR